VSEGGQLAAEVADVDALAATVGLAAVGQQSNAQEWAVSVQVKAERSKCKET
jgi:hypothetical protein